MLRGEVSTLYPVERGRGYSVEGRSKRSRVFRMRDTVDRRSTRLYCILLCFVAFTQARSSAAVRGAQCSLRSHVRLASRVLLREADVCSSPHDCSTDCCELGCTRGARYQIADVHGLQASSEVAYYHGIYC